MPQLPPTGLLRELCSHRLFALLGGCAVVLWQVDQGKRVAYPDNPDGYYYWTSVWYLDRADYFNSNDLFTDAQQCEYLTSLTTVQGTWGNIKSTPGRGNVIQHINRSLNFGGIPYDGSGYTLINIARAAWRSTTGRYSYKLCRLPIMLSQIDGKYLVGVGVPNILAQLNGCLFTAPLRNKYGERLTSVSVSPLIHPWQLRHGTKRRRRDPVV